MDTVNKKFADVKSVRKATAILATGMVAGTLDILGAILLHCFLLSHSKIISVLQAIASGLFGKAAYKGSWPMAIYGLAFHFIIALAFTAIYFYSYPFVSFLRNHKITSGFLYGVFVWLVMNLLLLPLSQFARVRFDWSTAAPGILVLILLFGLPISLMAARFYDRDNPAKVSQVYALH